MTLQIKTLSNQVDQYINGSQNFGEYINSVPVIINKLLTNTNNNINGERFLSELKDKNQDFYSLGINKINSGKKALAPTKVTLSYKNDIENTQIKPGYTIEEYQEFLNAYNDYQLLLDELEENGTISSEEKKLNPADILEIYRKGSNNDEITLNNNDFFELNLGNLLNIKEDLRKITDTLSKFDSDNISDEFDDDEEGKILTPLFKNEKISNIFNLGSKKNNVAKSKLIINNRQDISNILKIIENISEEKNDAKQTLGEYIDSLKIDENIVSRLENFILEDKKIRNLDKNNKKTLKYNNPNFGFDNLSNLINEFLDEKEAKESEERFRLVENEIKRIINTSLERKIGEGLSRMNNDIETKEKLKNKTYSRLYKDYNSGDEEKRKKVEKTLIYRSSHINLDLDGLKEKYIENAQEDNEEYVEEQRRINLERVRKLNLELGEYDGNVNSGMESGLGEGSGEGGSEHIEEEYDKTITLLTYIRGIDNHKIIDNLVLLTRDLNYSFFKVNINNNIKTIFVSDFYGKATYIFHGDLNIPNSGDINLSEIGNEQKISKDRVFYLGDEDTGWLGRINNTLNINITLSNTIQMLREIGFFRDEDIVSFDKMRDRVKEYNKGITEEIEILNIESINDTIINYMTSNHKTISVRFMKQIGLNQYLDLYNCTENQNGDSYDFETHIRLFFEGDKEALYLYEETIKELYKNKDHYARNQIVLSDINLIDRIIEKAKYFCSKGKDKNDAVEYIFGPKKLEDEKAGENIECSQTLIIALGGDPSEGISKDHLIKAAKSRKEKLLKNNISEKEEEDGGTPDLITEKTVTLVQEPSDIVEKTAFITDEILVLDQPEEKDEEVIELIEIFNEIIEGIDENLNNEETYCNCIKDEIDESLKFLEDLSESQIIELKEYFGFNNEIENRSFLEKIFKLDEIIKSNQKLKEIKEKENKISISDSEVKSVDDFKKLFELKENNSTKKIANRVNILDSKIRKEIYNYIFTMLNINILDDIENCKKFSKLQNLIGENKDFYEVKEFKKEFIDSLTYGNILRKKYFYKIMYAYFEEIVK